ncbi:MAG: DUF1934 domain-containing protein [Clostridia bacterium]|nr:DUF1934 domain-containing protein [Clostridia bacterium]
MTKRNIMIHMHTSRLTLAESLFEDFCPPEDFDAEEDLPYAETDGEMPEPSELWMEGKLLTGKDRVELVYRESELTGMAGTVTTIGFNRTDPTLISIMRAGAVRTVLTLEPGKHHFCLYNTPYSDFDICVHALRVENKLLTEGTMELDYLIEIHGAQAEHCKMSISIR